MKVSAGDRKAHYWGRMPNKTIISEGDNLLKGEVSLSGNACFEVHQGADHLHARRNRFLHTSIGELATTVRMLRQTNT